MNADLIRAQLVAELTAACAPTRVADEEPDLISDVTVCVCWVGAVSDGIGWTHDLEVRIILPTGTLAAAHFAERDRLVAAVMHRIYRWDPGNSRKPSRPAAELGTAIVGITEHRAVIVTTNVFETPDT